MPETQMSEQEIFQAYRPLLFSIAYRMLGSVMDAEDCVQEAFLQWHETLTRNPATSIEKPKAYLSTLVTRRCIDHLRSAQAQRESYVGLWLPDPIVMTDPSEVSELAESLSIAFMLLLERLSPLERAVFLLRQVFDYDYTEIATIVGKSAEYCRQLMHRARQHLPARHPSPTMSQDEQQQIFTQFLQAYSDGDMDGLLRLLSKEVVVHSDGGGKVSTALNPIIGPDKVARYLLGIQQKYFSLIQAEMQLALINGQLGLIGYCPEDTSIQEMLTTLKEKGRSGAQKGGMRETTKKQAKLYQRTLKKGEPLFIVALSLAEGQIQEIDIIANPEKLRHIPPLSFDHANS